MLIENDLRDHPIPTHGRDFSTKPAYPEPHPDKPLQSPWMRAHRLSGKPVPVPHHSHSKVFLLSNLNFSLSLIPLVLSLQDLIRSLMGLPEHNTEMLRQNFSHVFQLLYFGRKPKIIVGSVHICCMQDYLLQSWYKLPY